MSRARARWAWLGVVALSCASPAPAPLPTALGSVAVDVYGGLGGPVPLRPSGPRRVEVLVDATSSMLDRGPNGVSHLRAMRRESAEFLYSLREDTEISVRAFGQTISGSCVAPQRLVDPVIPKRREPLVQRIEDLSPRSEGSLAAALQRVRRDLVLEGAARRTRVVVFTDLDGSCGGDLCSEAAKLVDAGAWLEVVTLGSAEPPRCLSDLRPAAAQPSVSGAGFPARPPSFRVEAARTGEHPPRVLAEGFAGQGPVDVAPGLVTVVLDLKPPEEIGPFEVRPGEFARVRLLEAFDAALPTRVWRVERGDEPVARAFPPPSTLPPGARGTMP